VQSLIGKPFKRDNSTVEGKEKIMKNLLQRFNLFLLCTVLSSLSFTFSAHAENMKVLGNMEVHYIAIGSTFFTPKIAKAYDIERSRYNALINISVLDKTQAGKPAKSVSIFGKARNDLGQIKEIEFVEVKEGKAIYYLAQLKYSDEETYYFDLQINDGFETQMLSFKHKFYAD
jgi:hypothetical protein